VWGARPDPRNKAELTERPFRKNSKAYPGRDFQLHASRPEDAVDEAADRGPQEARWPLKILRGRNFAVLEDKKRSRSKRISFRKFPAFTELTVVRELGQAPAYRSMWIAKKKAPGTASMWAGTSKG